MINKAFSVGSTLSKDEMSIRKTHGVDQPAKRICLVLS